IDPQRHDTLALLDEANQLLPREARWQSTFATYFTDSLPESGVTWRCGVAGTPSAQAFPSTSGPSDIINLLGNLPALASTRYIDLARGNVVSESTVGTAAISTTPAYSSSEPSLKRAVSVSSTEA
ncbi:unnamed protein product, partial [Ectocarpus fasciculatus]